MKLEWLGHACFRLTAQDGTVVVTDPYDDSVGVPMKPIEADLLTMSHEHHDHNCMDCVQGSPEIARGLDSAAVGGANTWALASWHDEQQGALRGPNAIRIFEVDGLKVVHMGDQGCMPPEDVLEELSGADVMMIPVGGVYTVDAAGAKAILDRTHPCCVIPMHYRSADCLYDIDPVEPFLKIMGAEGTEPVRALDIMPGNVPEGVVLMEH